MSVTNTPAVTKRRRQPRPEQQVGLVIERVEHLTFQVKDAMATALLIDGLDRRIASLEDSLPVPSMVGWSHRFEDRIRASGSK